MANELIVRQNGIGGLVGDNPLTDVATTLTSDGLAALVAIGTTEFAWVIIDPDGIDGAPEHVKITAHTAGATTATILRTAGRQHVAGIPWIHGPVAGDFLDVWLVDVNPFMEPISKVGSWGPAVATQAINNGYGANITTPAQNNEVNYDLILSSGLWTLQLIAPTNTDAAIVTVQLDGTTLGTFDQYSGALTWNVSFSIAGIAIATPGKKRLKLLAATRNAGATNWFYRFSALQLRRTA